LKFKLPERISLNKASQLLGIPRVRLKLYLSQNNLIFEYSLKGRLQLTRKTIDYLLEEEGLQYCTVKREE